MMVLSASEVFRINMTVATVGIASSAVVPNLFDAATPFEVLQTFSGSLKMKVFKINVKRSLSRIS